jgi:diaminopimelate epimerase
MIGFAKAHAYGNDFLYVRQSEVQYASLATLAREMCDRHTGIGADGLIIYSQTSSGASMVLFNSDGSRAEVSGNGVRALGALIGLSTEAPALELAIDTEGGLKRLSRLERNGSRQLFRADMGVPRDIRPLRLQAAGEELAGVVLNMGNPQFIMLGSLPDDERFQRVGAALEWHAAFPNGTNVEFVQVESPSRLLIRIWERGVGPTMSSGTGSCASLVAAATAGGADREADVVAPGGVQRVEWTGDGVFLTGWAEVLCTGEWMRPVPAA